MEAQDLKDTLTPAFLHWYQKASKLLPEEFNLENKEGHMMSYVAGFIHCTKVKEHLVKTTVNLYGYN